MTNPYGEAANTYTAHGWRGVLPLPPGQKYPPPTGYTGAGGVWPSGADVWSWTEETPGANIGLRMPSTVVGFDVDNYGGKAGVDTLMGATARYGDLVPTWSITSRTDGISGIYLYQVPPGLFWPGEIGPGVEVIQTRHRYAVAPPSLHPEGRTYRWRGPGNTEGVRIPKPDDLPPLPDAWVAGITGGRTAADIAKDHHYDPGPWYTAGRQQGAPCGAVRAAVIKAADDLRAGTTSRHDVGMKAVMRLCWLSTEGHTGVAVAIDQVRATWHRAVTTGTSARDDASAATEWQRIMHGALAVLAADGGLDDPGVPDPCADPLAGILPPGTADPAPAPAPATYNPDTGTYDRPDPAPATPTDHAAAMAAAINAEALKLRIRNAAKALVDAEDAAAAWTPPPYRLSLVDDLDEPPDPVRFRVDELIPVNANVVLAASFKAGKTTLVNHLVRCLVDDLPFLGRYPVHPVTDGRVAVWNYEVSAGQYVGWLRDVNIRNAGAVSLLNLRGRSMPILNPHVQRWVVQWLTDHKIRTWVVDPFARAFVGNGENENSNTDVGFYLDTLDQIKELSGVAELIIPAHTGRAAMDQGAERVRGASRLDDWADVRWILTRDDQSTRYFRASGRDVETPEGTLLYDQETRNLTLTEGGRPQQVPKTTAASITDIEAALIKTFTDHPGISVRGIRMYVRGLGVKAGHDRIDDAVARMVDAGRVTVTTAGPGLPTGHYLAPGAS